MRDVANPYSAIAGRWRYRSFLNVLEPVQTLDDILFGEGELQLHPDGNGLISAGQLSFGADSPMVFTGQLRCPAPGRSNVPAISLEATAFGVAGTTTEGWVYAYQGWLMPTWPYATNLTQRVLTGTVVRVVAHGPQSPAGVVAAFVAVQYPLLA